MPTPTYHWHDPKCPGPRIEFEDHEPNCEIKNTCHLLPQCKIVPHCVACGRKPPIHDIISQSGNFSTIGAEPQGDPFGQLNLYWPSRSLYHGSADSTTSKQETREQALSKVYPTTLLPNQFRQACLSPTEGEDFGHARSTAMDQEDFPVHLTLEVYEVDNYPEYEAFSYTWEGEYPEKDKGPLLCRPVYIGSFWDVLMQTRNCWELLRFARLPHIARHIWVDAVCINQGNTEERARQVAAMGRIYGDSLRVVVYLGPDVVVKPTHRFPRRRHLDQFTASEARPMGSNGSVIDLDMEKLFRRRYFTRLWVIQELIVASKVIIRIGDMDVAADSIITKRLKNTPGWDWAKTSAPWFQYVTQQTLGTDPCEALQLVWNANCADSRDRLFGVLGLMNPEDILNRGVEANYSISSQHVWIGFFAHCLLRLDIFWFLTYAVGLRKSSQSQPIEPWIPSWVPDWTSRPTWQGFHRPTLSYEEVVDEISHAVVGRESCWHSFPSRGDITKMRLMSAKSGTPWSQGVTVDSKTGTLNRIRAIHLFAIPSTPQLRTHIGEYGVYEIDLHGMHQHIARQPREHITHKSKQPLYLVSQQPLDRDILPMHDHLYVLHTQQGLQFLILRDSEGPLTFLKSRVGPGYFNMTGHQNFRLVAAVLYTFLNLDAGVDHVFYQQTDYQPRSRRLSRFDLKIDPRPKHLCIEKLPRLLTGCQLIAKIRTLFNQKLKDNYRSHEEPSDPLNWHFLRADSSRYEKSFEWNQIFPGGKNWDLLSLCWELANEVIYSEARSDERLEKCFIALVEQKPRPVIRGGYVELRLEGAEWRYFEYTYSPPFFKDYNIKYSRPDWEWSIGGLKWSRVADKSLIYRHPQDEIHVRAPLSQILSMIRRCVHTDGIAKCIIWLRSVLDTDNLEDLQEQLTHTQRRFQNLKIEQEGFAIDGDVHTINIY
ncbi:hypothetical protein GQX73_g10632 [Xylaria multiplex]|uniref:Heterokaryon incompatibility domain-containing protein n=1 Tax=Xylaria multiplex TaxID=323545 RepID=A0A7C8IJZ4_9PEZI|nr:hypothetical protein GQX73_g10632 [Xylaria multiplex]